MKFVFYLIFFLLFLWGGLSKTPLLVEVEGTFFSLFLLLIAYIENKKIVFPKGALFLLAFCLIQIPFLILFKGESSINFFFLFLSGTFFLIASYNLHKYFQGLFEHFLLTLGLLFGAIYLISRFVYDPALFMKAQLFLTTPQYLHVHLGDLFAVIFTVALYRFLRQKQYIYLILLSVSTYFLVMSFSRSALVSVAVGLFYLFSFGGGFSQYKKLASFFFISVAALFLLEGVFKPILLHRTYYFQAIYAFITHPWGMGMGNFNTLSDFGLWGSTNSIYTHSLPLEVLVGVGIWGIPFFIWIYKVVKSTFGIGDEKSLVYRLAVVVLAVNFTFDTTYTIPVMFWLLFLNLGLAQRTC